MTTAAEFLAAAASEIGYTEITTPAGGNRTKFAAEAGHPNGYSWCLTFLDAIARRTFLELPAGVLATAYTPSAAGDFKRAGRWSEVPQVGAWVFFDFPGDGVNRIQHVAVVEAIHPDGTLTTIEGNTSFDEKGSQSHGGAVARRRRSTSAVKGYGLPLYTEPAVQSPPVVIVKDGTPEAALLAAYPALFGRPTRILGVDGVPATSNTADIAFGTPVWGAGTQIRGVDRYDTLRLALAFLAKK
jgi:hypothetical protein